MIKSYLQYIKEDLDNNLNYEKIEDIFLPLIEHCDWSIDYYNIYNLESLKLDYSLIIKLKKHIYNLINI